MREKKKMMRIMIWGVALILFVSLSNVTTYAMGGSSRSVASYDSTIRALMANQSYSLRTRAQIESYYQHFMHNSSWKPSGYFPHKNSGSYKYTISDNKYTYNAGGAKGCMLYSQFVSGVVYGKHRNAKTYASSTTASGIKNLITQHAQFGEHIRVDYTHSVTFLAADDNGFYGTEYWTKDSSIHLVYYTYSNFASQAGSKSVWIYNIDMAINQKDNMRPSIQNVKIVSRDRNGFTMQCFVSDNVGVSRVQFPTWQSSKTSAGCTWYNGVHIGGGVWQFRFNDAAAEGYYTTHIYAWDTVGNSVCHDAGWTYVDKTGPQISNVKVTEKTADGYKVTCKVTDNMSVDRVQYPTWTEKNGQDDILGDWGTNSKARGRNCGNGVWEFYVKRSEHNGEYGNYITHIYAYDSSGNYGCFGLGSVRLENGAPLIANVKVSNVTKDGYTVTCTVADDYSGISRVQFPTWTQKKGQDDIVGDWYTNSKCSGTHIGNNVYSFRVKKTDHKNETGVYYTHIYAYDSLQNRRFGGEVKVEIKAAATGTTNISTKKQPAVGTVMTVANVKYKVMKNGTGCYVQCIGPKNKNITSATISSYVYINSYKYPVTHIQSNAFKGCKKLKSVTIGDNVKVIGKNAFYGCKKLRSVTIRSSKITTINKNAFKGIYTWADIKVPKAKKTAYKKLLKKAGVTWTVLIRS